MTRSKTSCDAISCKVARLGHPLLVHGDMGNASRHPTRLAVVIVTAWLVGKHLHDGLVVFLISVAITSVVVATAAATLLRSSSPGAHGLAISLVGSSAIVVAGGLVYGAWILRW